MKHQNISVSLTHKSTAFFRFAPDLTPNKSSASRLITLMAVNICPPAAAHQTEGNTGQTGMAQGQRRQTSETGRDREARHKLMLRENLGQNAKGHVQVYLLCFPKRIVQFHVDAAAWRKMRRAANPNRKCKLDLGKCMKKEFTEKLKNK